MTKADQVWEAHRNCAVCGTSNMRGLSLRFRLRPDGVAEAKCRISSALQGYTGIVQGGVAAAMLDSVMVNCIWLSTGCEAVTVEMNVRYHAEIPVGSAVVLEGRILRERRGLFLVGAVLTSAGQAMASAEAKFLRRK